MVDSLLAAMVLPTQGTHLLLGKHLICINDAHKRGIGVGLTEIRHERRRSVRLSEVVEAGSQRKLSGGQRQGRREAMPRATSLQGCYFSGPTISAPLGGVITGFGFNHRNFGYATAAAKGSRRRRREVERPR